MEDENNSTLALLTELPILRSLSVVFYNWENQQRGISRSQIRFNEKVYTDEDRERYATILTRVADKGLLQVLFKTNLLNSLIIAILAFSDKPFTHN